MGETTVKMETIVEEYKNAPEGSQLGHVVPDLDLIHYVPINIKKAAIETIIENLGKESASYTLTVNSIDAYHVMITTILQLYTNIEITPENTYQVLDGLMEAGLIDVIFEEIGDDADEFEDLYRLAWDDVMRVHNSLEAIVSRELRFINLSIQEAIVEGAKAIDSTEVMKAMIDKIKTE